MRFALHALFFVTLATLLAAYNLSTKQVFDPLGRHPEASPGTLLEAL